MTLVGTLALRSLRKLRNALLIGALFGLAGAGPLDDPCVDRVECTIQIEDLPVVLLSGGGYEVGPAEGTRTPLSSGGLAQVKISKRATIELWGPAYEGAVTLAPADCDEGAVHLIRATPKPARLVFQAGDVPLSQLSVSCVDGCPYETRTATGFPELPFPRGQTELVVELEFKAHGYRSAVGEYKLSPGDNAVRVTLEKI